MPSLACTACNSEMAFAWVVKSDACAPRSIRPFYLMNSRFLIETNMLSEVAVRLLATFFLAMDLSLVADQTVSTLVTYVLIVNTLSSFDIRIEDPRGYVKFFPKRNVIQFSV